jgi:hypothetical protein
VVQYFPCFISSLTSLTRLLKWLRLLFRTKLYIYKFLRTSKIHKLKEPNRLNPAKKEKCSRYIDVNWTRDQKWARDLNWISIQSIIWRSSFEILDSSIQGVWVSHLVSVFQLYRLLEFSYPSKRISTVVSFPSIVPFSSFLVPFKFLVHQGSSSSSTGVESPP